jgi:hypothetical protein
MCTSCENNDAVKLPGIIEQEHWQKLGHWWREAMTGIGQNLAGFDSVASLSGRLNWCRERNIPIACGYGRFSTKMQKSDQDQARAMVQTAAQKGVLSSARIYFH